MTVIVCTPLFLSYPKLSAIAFYHDSCVLNTLKETPTTSFTLFCLEIVTEPASDNLLTAQMRRNWHLRFTLC